MGVLILSTVQGPILARTEQKPTVFHVRAEQAPADGTGTAYFELVLEEGQSVTVLGPDASPMVVFLRGTQGRRVTLIAVVDDH